jgi:hypothetical protein
VTKRAQKAVKMIQAWKLMRLLLPCEVGQGKGGA